MKKIVLGVLFSFILGVLPLKAASSTCANADIKSNELVQSCKSAYLCDYYSGECVYEYNSTVRIPIASVCKVMTLNLCFEAIERGDISFDSKITVSSNASGMGGSQVFLKDGLTYSVEQLIKSVVVCSANDSCVALAEAICGSEDDFVLLMNERAKEYGCENTLFSNCTGLPKDTQYSCAKDVAVMFKQLIGHEDYYKFSKVWLEDFEHPDGRVTSMTNTNKLIRKYSSCDGGKTGFTSDAGFCLASTAKKDNLRLISVVLGADSSDNRFSSTTRMFNYGFANYKNAIVLDENINLNQTVCVVGSNKESICVKPIKTESVFMKKGENPSLSFNFVPQTLHAPVSKGDNAGVMEIYKNGVLYDTVDVVAAEDAQKASYFDNLKKVANNWVL